MHWLRTSGSSAPPPQEKPINIVVSYALCSVLSSKLIIIAILWWTLKKHNNYFCFQFWLCLWMKKKKKVYMKLYMFVYKRERLFYLFISSVRLWWRRQSRQCIIMHCMRSWLCQITRYNVGDDNNKDEINYPESAS